jgi:hypothetical protein
VSDDLNESVFAELVNGEYEATVVLAPDDAMDGWIVRVFPTLVPTRIIVGINANWAQEVIDHAESDEELKEFEQELITETTWIVHNYFVAARDFEE